jgi:3'-5' exonuclease
MKPFFLDIETIPGQRPGLLEEMRAAVTAPAQYKKADSIAAWLAENRDAEGEAAWLKTSFDGGLGQVCVIGIAIDDGPAYSISVGDLSVAEEARALRALFTVLGELPLNTRIVGHNVVAFDIRFLWQRAMVLGIKPPPQLPRDPKPWSEQVFDTMVAWAGQRGAISMNNLCRVFDMPGKGDMDGSQVWPMVRDGRIAEVSAYCRGDVERTRALFSRMTFASTEEPTC